MQYIIYGIATRQSHFAGVKRPAAVKKPLRVFHSTAS